MIGAPIVILGATSQIARDFVVGAHRTAGAEFSLHARNPAAVRAFMAENDLPDRWTVGPLADLEKDTSSLGDVRAIVNFVGVGDPAKAKSMGAAIFEATLVSDALARRVVAERPTTPYVFLSSGAVYGTTFSAPADASTPSVVPVNAIEPQHWYSVAKLHAEAMHRSSVGATILDLRIFNYFSRTLNVETRFLVTDMLRCVRDGSVFETTDAAITRDYLHPEDMTNLLLALVDAPPGSNMPVDAYSRAPIAKADLVALFERELGLRARIAPQAATVNATGVKPEYYSRNRTAALFGYAPKYTSGEGVLIEAVAILERLKSRV